MESNNFWRGHAIKIIVGILLILLFVSVASAGIEGAIKLGAFNLQIFGPTKASNPEVMNVLSKIIRNYDVIAVEEIMDASQTALPSLNNSVNSMGSPQYDYVVSERLGRTTSKEQYAYFYNTKKIELVGNPYVFPDSEDLFEREPFIANFKAKNGSLDFVSITIHAKPENATQEINDLPLVVDDAKRRYQGEDDFIIMGDLNADCDYFDENSQSPLKSSDYFWIINNNVDTTTKSTVCTYDRIIITTPAKNDFTGDSGVFRFDTVYNLTYENTTAVSDHYPVYADFWSIDTISPSTIANLTNITYAPTYINFTWTNPPDPDFSYVMLYLNGTLKTSIPAPQNYYNFTGLDPDTSYELGTHTVDSSGNVNETWVNATVRTAPSVFPPIQISSPSANPSIILNDNGRGRPTGTNITRLNVTVTGNVASVTIDLSSIGGSARSPMIKISGTDIYTTTTNATSGINLTNDLVVNATNNSGNFNNSVAIPITVLLRGDIVRDNKIDLKDLLYMRRYIAGLDPSINTFVADIQQAEGDNKVDLKDLLLLRRYLAGQEPLI